MARLLVLLALASVVSGQQCNGIGDFSAACSNFTVYPTGNAAGTLAALSVQGVTVADDEREFLMNLGLLSNRGNHSRPTPYHDKVTLYAGIVGEAGTGDIWAINPLVTQSPGSGDYNAQGIELDFNNANAHRGDADAGDGLAPPVSYGLSISGAAPFRSTAAMVVSGNAGMWNRGIVLANDCVAQSSFQDLGSPQKSVDIRGNPVYGVYQSSSTTQNYFAGKTGVATQPPSAADDSVLRIGGSMSLSGRIARPIAPDFGFDGPRGVDHSAMLTRGVREWVTLHGVSILDGTGSVRVVAAPVAEVGAYDVGRDDSPLCTYQLTAVGAPMPSLHVLVEAAISMPGGLTFAVAGGVPAGKVSWSLTCPARAA